MRNLANLIPGLGISGIVLLLITPLASLATSLFQAGKAASDAKDNTAALQKQYEQTEAIIGKAGDGFEKATVEVETLKTEIDLAKQGFLDKEKVLKQYNDTVGKTTGQTDSLSKAEQLLIDKGPAYIKVMLLKAAATLALEDAAKKTFEAEQTRRKKEEDFAKGTDDVANLALGAQGGEGQGIIDQKEFDDNKAKLKALNEKRRKDRADEAEKDGQALIDIANKFRSDAAKLAKEAGLIDGDDKNKSTVDKLSVAEQNALKLIEETRLRLLAIENTSTNEIQKVRDLSLKEEIKHLETVEAINVDALNKKSQLLLQKGKLNAEEKRSLAEYGEQRSTIELQTSQKIAALQKKFADDENQVLKKKFDETSKTLKNELDEQIRITEAANKQIQDDPSVNNVGKALAQEQADNAIIELQQQHYAHLQQLNDKFNQEALAKASEATDKAIAASSRDRSKIALAELKDIQVMGAAKVTQIETEYSKQIKIILDSETLSMEKKQQLIVKLTQAEKRTILTAELETLNAEVAQEAILLANNAISYEEYLATIQKQKQKAAEVSAASPANDPTKSKNPIAGLFGFKAGSNEEKGVQEVVAASYAFAQDAMNGFFDAERERVQQSLKLAEERIESDRKSALSRAQSQAEEDSLNRQFDQKKLAAQKLAFEQTKKIKKSEAKIAFATEIANIFATAFQLGPIAGPIVGAILAGLAAIRLGVNLGRIDKETFAYGGNPDMTTTRGGRVKGRSHSQGGNPFLFKGRVFEDEVDELNVIRTKNAPANKPYTISGTHTQIASLLNQLGGGKAFAPGATLKRFEYGGNLGESLQAPVFIPSNQGSGPAADKLLDAIREQSENLQTVSDKIEAQTKAINGRIDRLEVVQVTDSVTSAQKKKVRQSSLGTL